LGEQEELTAISSSRRAANKGTAPLSLPGFRAKNRFLQQQDIVERERERKEMRPIKEQEEDETRLRRERRSRKKNGRGGGVIMFDHYGVAAAARCFVPWFPGCGGWWGVRCGGHTHSLLAPSYGSYTDCTGRLNSNAIMETALFFRCSHMLVNRKQLPYSSHVHMGIFRS
jgi:hypothetical protein